jgi:hypothetical protein
MIAGTFLNIFYLMYIRHNLMLKRYKRKWLVVKEKFLGEVGGEGIGVDMGKKKWWKTTFVHVHVCWFNAWQ